MKHLNQRCPQFTDENREVWYKTIQQKNLFLKKYVGNIYQPYLEGYDKLGFIPEHIPSEKYLTKVLSLCGWKPIFVNGYIPTKAYAGLLLNKIVPISPYVRSKEHLQYAPAPDFIHDVIGHLPMLFHHEYVEYLMEVCHCIAHIEPTLLDTKLYTAQKELADLGFNAFTDTISIQKVENEINHIEEALNANPSKLHILERLFLWTIEFGTILHNGFPKLYGAGLMSSSLEAEFICIGKTQLLPFSYELLLQQFNFSKLQEKIFFSDSFLSMRKKFISFKDNQFRLKINYISGEECS